MFKKSGLWEFAWRTYRIPELVWVSCVIPPTSWGVQYPDHAKSQRAKKSSIGILVLLVLALGLVGTALAQEPTPPTDGGGSYGGRQGGRMGERWQSTPSTGTDL
ncbi:MAG: hypothetical protein GY832_47780 [Chloroflexi bacterium]|nr:hypothetical protein [Chloroflexota bacterium]